MSVVDAALRSYDTDMLCTVDQADSDVTGGGGFFFQAEDGIRDLVRSRGLGDVYKRQGED